MPVETSKHYLSVNSINSSKTTIDTFIIRLSLTTAKQILRLIPDDSEQDDDQPENTKQPGVERPEAAYTFERQNLLQIIVDTYRDWLQSHVSCYLQDDIFKAIILGLDAATRIYKNSWTRTTDNRVFTKVLYGIIKFTELAVFPSKKILLLDQVPQILRNKLYCHVPQMSHIVILNLGSGSGGTVTDAFEDKFIVGISSLHQLQQLTLRYDCTDRILEATAKCCKKTLVLLDVERSLKVTDIGAEHILHCTQLRSLDIFHTSISIEGKAKILFGLPLLEDIPRGDFLCEALEHVEEENPEKLSTLNISGFWASEEYFFHSTDQLELVSKLCPSIQRMLFMFNNQESMFRDIIAFNQLKEVDLSILFPKYLHLMLLMIAARYLGR